jgi:hypothetical protein
MQYIVGLIGAIVVIIVLALVISNEDLRRQCIGGFLLLFAFCLFLFDANFQTSHQIGNQTKEDLANDEHSF